MRLVLSCGLCTLSSVSVWTCPLSSLTARASSTACKTPRRHSPNMIRHWLAPGVSSGIPLMMTSASYVVDSDGCHHTHPVVGFAMLWIPTAGPLPFVMWRANRLVDGLAKIAAGRHRLPDWAFKMLGAAAQLVKHAAAQLGVVTHRANNHKVAHLIEGGAMVTKICRDSTADSRPRGSKDKPPANSASTSASSGPAMPTTSAAPVQTAARRNPA